jgi:hypothetical protein
MLVSAVEFCVVRHLASTCHIPVHRIHHPRHHLQIVYRHRGCPGCIVIVDLAHRHYHLLYPMTCQHLFSNSPPLFASGSCQMLSNSFAIVNSMRSNLQHSYYRYHYLALSSDPVTILSLFECVSNLPSRQRPGSCHHGHLSLRDHQLTG